MRHLEHFSASAFDSREDIPLNNLWQMKEQKVRAKLQLCLCQHNDIHLTNVDIVGKLIISAAKCWQFTFYV